MKKLLGLLLAVSLLLGCVPAMADGAVDGTYATTCHGFYGDFPVTVTIADGKIADIVCENVPETPELGGEAIRIMTQRMIDANTSGVDMVTGATVTSAVFRLAVNNALKEAGAPAEMTAASGAAQKTAETIACDVLVMGGGVAGMSAAIAAAEKGAKVVLIEKQDLLGGSSVTAAGIVYAPLDDDDKAVMVDYYMERAEGNADRELLTFFADNARDTLTWLESMGVQWMMNVPAGTAPQPRAYFSMLPDGRAMTGAALTLPMIDRMAELGVTVMTGVKGTDLIVADGKVAGAVAQSKTCDYTFESKSVVLATGGYDASSAMKAQYAPYAEKDFPLSTKGNVGEGILMGQAIGAATEFKGGMIGFDFVDGSLPESGYNAVAMYCVSYVEPDGTFVGPVIDYPITYKEMHDRGVNFFGLYDGTGADSAERAVAVNFGWKGDTAEELAAATGMDAAKLADALAQSGLTQAPFYAVTVKPCTIGSMGGLKINTAAQVLAEDGTPIEGLYASGEVANGGFFYQVYPASGSSLSLGMTFGLEAGRNAADNAAK